MRRRLHVLAGLSLLGLLVTGTAAGQARLWEEPGPCDRECLNRIADTYIDAMVAGDPDAAPFSDDVKYTENTAILEIGQGLWETATGASDTFRIYVPDPVARQIGFMGLIQAGPQSRLLALRLKVEDDEITEVEHLVANVGPNALPNLQTPRESLVTELPQRDRIPRELMLVIAASYYDALLQSNGEATLFADDCERHENGMITAGGEGLGFDGRPRQSCFDQMNSRTFTYITSIDLQRVWIADEVTGLVFSLSHFRHAFETNTFQVYGPDGEITERQMDYEPFDFAAAHIQKIENYRISDQEAMGVRLPYRSTNGWNPFWR
ncbi:MAG TPA: hypothetical protein VF339_05665 [Gammaproteobacteria bacterium]